MKFDEINLSDTLKIKKHPKIKSTFATNCYIKCYI